MQGVTELMEECGHFIRGNILSGDELEAVGTMSGIRQQITLLLLKVGDAEVDLLHSLHLGIRQQSTGTDKVLIDLIQ